MRKTLLNHFNDIYIINLHGNAQKKEMCTDGSIDQNVFDIMQGVSVNIFIKKNNNSNKSFANLRSYDLQGKREYKYNFLNQNTIKSIQWDTILYDPPNYFFIPQNIDGKIEYGKRI